MLRSISAAGLALAVLAVSGCAVGPDRRDPLENFNRKVMDFNEAVDGAVLKPVATAYRDALPPLVRTGVSNFFGNLSDGWSFVNSALQGKGQFAAENWMRLNVNTFFGLGGLLDVASELGIERHREDFGQTLGRWGMPAGPYLMLPLLGPSTLRDAAVLPIENLGDPVSVVDPTGARYSLVGLRVVNTRSNLLRVGSVLESAALDRYSFVRDAYLQRRRAEVFEAGEPRSENDGWEADETEVAGTPAPIPAEQALPPAGR